MWLHCWVPLQKCGVVPQTSDKWPWIHLSGLKCIPELQRACPWRIHLTRWRHCRSLPRRNIPAKLLQSRLYWLLRRVLLSERRYVWDLRLQMLCRLFLSWFSHWEATNWWCHWWHLSSKQRMRIPNHSPNGLQRWLYFIRGRPHPVRDMPCWLLLRHSGRHNIADWVHHAVKLHRWREETANMSNRHIL